MNEGVKSTAKKVGRSIKRGANTVRGFNNKEAASSAAFRDAVHAASNGSRHQITKDEHIRRKKLVKEKVDAQKKKQDEAKSIGKNTTRIEYTYAGALKQYGDMYAIGEINQRQWLVGSSRMKQDAVDKYGEAAKKERERYNKKQGQGK